MFVARMVASTRASEVRYDVTGFDGRPVVVTRSAVKAARIAVLLNAGAEVTAAVLYG